MSHPSAAVPSSVTPSSTTAAEILAAVEVLGGARVLCIGDCMLDRYVYGQVERISPEAPIPVLRVTREMEMLGGAGNVLRNLVALGARCWFLTAVGEDIAGIALSQLVGQEAEVTSQLLVEPNRSTTLKTRFVADSHQLLRADQETVAPIAPDTIARTLAAAEEALAEVSVLVLSDYGKGMLVPEVLAPLIKAARARGVTIVCDPKGRDYSRYHGIDILTPNRRELSEATGLSCDSDASVIEAARGLIRQHGIGHILVTRSERGMTLVTEEDAQHLPAEAREVFDVSGAGDTVVAGLATALAAGLPLHSAAMLANIAAGIVVGKVGTAVVQAEEMADALRHQASRSAGKLMTREQAAGLVGAWRRSGLQIGFTNGCFDLLHPGHVSLLSQAKAGCDRLIVGLNSDASVQRLKGPMRPVQAEQARAAVLAALAVVDLVVLFDEDTPQALIEALEPDLLVKGADYTVDTVVGAAFVQSYGGRVMLAELTPGQSTSGLVQKMKGPSGGA